MAEILTLRQAAQYLKITPPALYRMAREGRLPASKVGNRWRFQREVLDEWLRRQAQPTFSHRPTILVVDDDKTLSEAIAEVLEEEGYKVFATTTGQAAKDLLSAVRFEVAFVDLKLPDMSGVDVLRAFSQERPETRLVIITGYPDSQLMDQALEVGSHTVLKKPFRVQKLLEIAATLAPKPASGLKSSSTPARR